MIVSLSSCIGIRYYRFCWIRIQKRKTKKITVKNFRVLYRTLNLENERILLVRKMSLKFEAWKKTNNTVPGTVCYIRRIQKF